MTVWDFILQYILVIALALLFLSIPVLFILKIKFQKLPTASIFFLIFSFEEITGLSVENRQGNVDINDVERGIQTENDAAIVETSTNSVYPMTNIERNSNQKTVKVSHKLLLSLKLPECYINEENISAFKTFAAVIGFFHLCILYLISIRLIIIDTRTSEVCLDGYHCRGLPRNLTCFDLENLQSTNSSSIEQADYETTNTETIVYELSCISFNSFNDMIFVNIPLFYGFIQVLKFVNVMLFKLVFKTFKSILCLSKFLLHYIFILIAFGCIGGLLFLMFEMIYEAINDYPFLDTKYIENLAFLTFCLQTVVFSNFLWFYRSTQKDTRSFDYEIRNVALLKEKIVQIQN